MAKPFAFTEYMAESEGFEPSRRFHAYTISSRAPSAARTTLRVETYKNGYEIKTKYMAERVGFEPTVPCGTLDFESSTFDLSDTSPLIAVKHCQLAQNVVFREKKPALLQRTLPAALPPLPPIDGSMQDAERH